MSVASLGSITVVVGALILIGQVGEALFSTPSLLNFLDSAQAMSVILASRTSGVILGLTTLGVGGVLTGRRRVVRLTVAASVAVCVLYLTVPLWIGIRGFVAPTADVMTGTAQFTALRWRVLAGGIAGTVATGVLAVVFMRLQSLEARSGS